MSHCGSTPESHECECFSAPPLIAARKRTHRIDREKMAKVTWLKPKTVAEIAFNEMTGSGHLRHAKFLRLRESVDLRKRRR